MGVTCTVTNSHRFVDKDCWCNSYDHEIDGCRKFMVTFSGENKNCYSKTLSTEKAAKNESSEHLEFK